MKGPTTADHLRHFHFVMTLAWSVVLIFAISGLFVEALVFLLSVKFISICSIYANQIGHWSAWQASRSESISDEGSSFGDES